MLLAQSRLAQQRLIDCTEPAEEFTLVFGRAQMCKGQRVLADGGKHLLCDVLAHLVVCHGDMRADGGADVLGGCAEIAHLLHRLAHDVADRAAPSRMHRGDHARAGIGKQDRHAVGDANAERRALGTAHQRIPLKRSGGIDTVTAHLAIHHDHVRRMDLRHDDQRLGIDIDRLTEALDILFHDDIRVAAVESEIERLCMRLLRHAAEAGGKAVAHGVHALGIKISYAVIVCAFLHYYLLSSCRNYKTALL